MFYYYFHFESMYTATDRDFFYAFDEKLDEDKLESMAAEISMDCADDYAYLVEDEGETEEEIENALEMYYESCECTCEEISEDEYDAAVG